MEYSSVMRLKIVIWTILVILIVAGSNVLASWDRDVVIESYMIQEVVPTKAIVTGSIISGDINTGVVETTIVYLNDRQYVDVQQVRDTWMQWTNYLRTEQLGGRDAYRADWRLNATADAWSQQAARQGSISHKRSASDGYYNYNGLVSWFNTKGEELTGNPIVFKNVSRATFSESIGRGVWHCKEADCTNEMIEATRSTWDFFYGERSYNGVHYRALTHKLFGLQGLGIAFAGNRYYLTIHYGTQILE